MRQIYRGHDRDRCGKMCNSSQSHQSVKSEYTNIMYLYYTIEYDQLLPPELTDIEINHHLKNWTV